MKTGKIIQVLGPVVDVEFENQELPAIRDALEVQNGDKKCVMEVAQHIGNHVVRCIMLAASEGLHRARVIADKMLENYESGKIDEVYIIYTKMINSVTAEPEMIQLLPFRKMDFKISQADVYHEEIIIEPSPRAVMDRIVPNYITGFIYGALVESFCSEQNSRMMAMDSATRSAKDMLADLSIKYNRARQAAITQEITEVVGGAKALQNKK